MDDVDDEALQRAIRDACLGRQPPAGASELPARIGIYRRLVRNTLRGVAEKLLERTRREMGAGFDDAFARFLEERGPETHFLRDVPHEFLAWVTPRWRAEGVAPWLIDLSRHELTSFGVSTAPHLPEPRATEVALDRPLLLSSLARIERYDHAVHEDETPPPARPTALLYYRDDAHALQLLELTPLAAALLERSGGAPLEEAIRDACRAASVPMGDDALVVIARLLADLGARGVLLGAREA